MTHLKFKFTKEPTKNRWYWRTISDWVRINHLNTHSQPRGRGVLSINKFRDSDRVHIAATFIVTHDHFNSKRFGFSFLKHFVGGLATTKRGAIIWLNLMLNNCPDYAKEFSLDKDQTSELFL